MTGAAKARPLIGRQNGGCMEIYVHIPFCVKKCDYCDFLSAPGGADQQAMYVQALQKEISAVQEGKERSVSSIFFGGGTPSLLNADLTERILDKIKEKFRVEKDAEITIETNPGTLGKPGTEHQKLKTYLDAGINRLSLGLQSPDDAELRMLGRIHTFAEFLESYQAAREAGFENINIDLMSAIPEQTCEEWIRNLRTAAKLKPEHISAYSLIIEEGTPFAERCLKLPDEDEEYQMYEDTAAILGEYGYHQYEISNYAKEGRECRHNIGYWERTDYLGFGLGAASLWGNRRFSNTRNMDEYLRFSDNPEKIRIFEPALTKEDEMAEFMFLGLRMTKGVSAERFRENFGRSIEDVYGNVLDKYTGLGLLEKKDGRIFLTRQGIHVSNVVMAEFL